MGPLGPVGPVGQIRRTGRTGPNGPTGLMSPCALLAVEPPRLRLHGLAERAAVAHRLRRRQAHRAAAHAAAVPAAARQRHLPARAGPRHEPYPVIGPQQAGLAVIDRAEVAPGAAAVERELPGALAL